MAVKTVNFLLKHWDIFSSAQNIDCALLHYKTASHNLCFWAKVGKFIYTPASPYIKVAVIYLPFEIGESVKNEISSLS